MASIEDIRINGQQSSNTVTPVVAGLSPVITWDYIEDAADPSQLTYDIKIGTNTTDWGTSLFNGNRLDDSISSTANVHEYSLHNLTRGQTYYGQVRAVDSDGDITAWGRLSFKINNLPFVTGFSLSPSSPSPSDDLDLDYTYHDLDSQDQSGTKIRWFKNNLPQAAHDNLCILPSSFTNPGESWTAKIIPSDGLEFGPTVETLSVTIGSIDVNFENIKILPADANVDDLLKAEFTLIDDEYLQFTSTEYEWYVNGILIVNSNKVIIRLQLDPGDVVTLVVKIMDGDNIVAQAKSKDLVISDVPWYIIDLEVSGLRVTDNITDLAPYLEWNIHKTTAARNTQPSFLQVLVTKTPSESGAIYNSGVISYTKNSFDLPENVLSRGQKYFIHVGAGDTAVLDQETFLTKEVVTAGSSWAESVDNALGWTIETKVSLSTDVATANLGIYIHDGSFFCSVIFGQRTITFLSGEKVEYAYVANQQDLSAVAHVFKITGKGQYLKIFMDNQLVVDVQGGLSNVSGLKFIEYGDVDPENSNAGVFRFFRYSTIGAFGFGDDLPNENVFHFDEIGTLSGGSIDYIFDNKISWLPDDVNESAKIILFNENSKKNRLPTVTRNFSPITSIYIDENRNKYIGTANGVTAIFGEKHDADYSLDTSSTDVQIMLNDFDRISDVPTANLSAAEPDTRDGWFTLDTTLRAVSTEDPYITSHAIHYYTQRTHGHAWFDNADNEKGWQISYSFDMDILEADDFVDRDIDKTGFGVYINDGVYQEILYFYEDRIRLFYANVFVPINTKSSRDYVISGQGQNIFVYQKLTNAPVGSHQLLINGSGLFTMPAARTANSRKPKIALDSTGVYHAVWHDDNNTRSQIFYSSFDGSSWSVPELVSPINKFNLRNPTLDTDSSGKIWVAYEDNSWGKTEISVSVRDTSGWNPRTRITNSPSDKKCPVIKVDISNNAHVVWEDNRNGHWEIFWAEWQDTKKAWISSAQFGDDLAVMRHFNTDPYQVDEAVDFKNADLAVLGTKLWLVSEAHLGDGTSIIYRGFRDLENEFWATSGTPVLNDDGEVSGFGLSTLSSPLLRNCVKPTIAASSQKNQFAIFWEDQTEPVSQIWGSAYSSLSIEIIEATQITSGTSDSKDPSSGWAGNFGVCVFERNNGIYLVHYDSAFLQFFGSATGGEDKFLTIDTDKKVFNPSLPDFSPSSSFITLYDFLKDRDPYTLSTLEFPDFHLIGDVMFEHVQSTPGSSNTTTTTLSNGQVSTIDSKEFAFGDFSDNVGLVAHWKNIEMYFGYDARPFSTSSFNASTVRNWPDDRVNDLFIDVFGNVIAATFGGLVYHNTFTGETTNIQGRVDPDVGCLDEQGVSNNNCLLLNRLTTSVAWGKNGMWYVGTTSGVFVTRTAGRAWTDLFSGTGGALEGKIVNDITVDSAGRAIIAAHSPTGGDTSGDGIYIAHPDMTAPIFISTPNTTITSVAVDAGDIIWAGSSSGLFRIENFTNIISFGRNQGMRSSHVNDIAIVNKHLRYIGTSTGVERMNGMKFTNFNVSTHELLNNNIATLKWDETTNSLWVAALYQLHEIVFRDTEHDIVQDEIVAYTTVDLSTERVFDSDLFFVLDFDTVQPDPDNPLTLSSESASVFINKNPISFGFTVDEVGQSILFVTDLLVGDEVEVELSNQFIKFHDFNQSSIEQEALGEKRTNILKIDSTQKGQLLLLSNIDRNEILLFGGESSLPFTTIMLDRDLPVGCIELLETLSPTVLRFRIIAFDRLSGLDGMILSNFENFTSDGEAPQDFQPFQEIIEHDIGAGLTNVIDSLSIPSTATIGANTFNVGSGSALGSWVDEATNTEFLYAGTSEPAVIFRYDPVLDTWTALQALDDIDQGREVTQIKNINNVLWVATGSDSSGSNGGVYRTTDGTNFELIGSVTGTHVRGIVGESGGTVFFGSSDGKIYSYRDGVFSVKYQNIGQTIYGLAVFGTTLVAATGDLGRIYSIDLETDGNLIVFDASDDFIRDVHVKDAESVTSPDQAILFAAAGTSTTIYRARFDNFDFIKSFSSFGKNVNRIKDVETISLFDPSEQAGISGTTIIGAVGNSLFKHVVPAWEFFFLHDEEIKDFEQYFSSGTEGIWVISDTKVTKWTAVRSTKTMFLKLKDKAGNFSRAPLVGGDNLCPTDTVDVCCDYAYSINISDLQNFVNESRIVDIDEYGVIQFTYDSPNDHTFYSADQIDQETGIYTSEIFNGSNEIVSWKSVSWESTEPAGTEVDLQIRNGITEDDTAAADWSVDLVKDDFGNVNIEHITDQYIQFRAILKSQSRDLSPTLTSVTIRNITAQASHFFTTNFVLPSRPIKGLLTSNTFIPVSSDIVFGVTTNNSVDFGDYQIIEPNRLFTSSQGQFGTNLRVGAKLLSPGLVQVEASNNPGDPYDESSFICDITFTYQNINVVSNDYHFRVRFYNDPFRTQLLHTFFSGNDQTGWTLNGGFQNVFPSGGATLASEESASITFTPGSEVSRNQKWFVNIDAFDGSVFEDVLSNKSFVCSNCNITNEPGLIAEYYTLIVFPISVPSFTSLNPAVVTLDSILDFGLFTSTPWVTSDGTSLGSNFINSFAARWRGKVFAPVAGEYTFQLGSDDGGLLFINQTEVVDNDGPHTFTTVSGSISLIAGFHDIEVQYFEGSGDAGLQLSWIIPGESTSSIIPANRLFHAVASEYCDLQDIPRILNFAVLFELENGETVKVNLE